MNLSLYPLETFHQDGEFILYRGQRQTKRETSPPSILGLSPVMERPAPATINKIGNRRQIQLGARLAF